ncbi:MAG: hypothetical protein M1820_004142 [Bogoriella megaspora]|nr:MAG: hypothetical protein M1820_004142 [Bogoriella megaspora]
MPLILDRLPFDIIFRISLFLNIDDLAFLGKSCKHLALTWAPFTLEAQAATHGLTSYSSAFSRLLLRREANAQIRPCSYGAIATGSEFVYGDGFLCYLRHDRIRILNIHKLTGYESVLSIPSFLSRAKFPHTSQVSPNISLVTINDGLLTLLVEDDENSSAWLIVFAVENPEHLIKLRVDAPQRISVCNNARYLLLATHSEIGSHGHHEWVVRGIDMEAGSEIGEEHGIQLDNLAGYDVGNTVTFKIHNGYFYALSNQTSFDLEEIDYTSFYTCMRFPIDKPLQSELQVVDDIYRRQNSEGAINDSWTDLSLQVDESTKELMIVEARREYLNNTSRHQRTFYIQPVPFPTSPTSSSDFPASLLQPSSSGTMRHPANDIYIPLLTPADRPRYAQPRPRTAREVHREFGEHPPGHVSQAPTFLLSKTKHRTYNFSSSSFLDLVEDEELTSEGYLQPSLRLRGGGRRLASPLDEQGWLRKPSIDPETGTAIEGSEDRYIYDNVRLWPPRRAGDGIRLPYGKVLRTVADERVLIYMISQEKAREGENAIVLASFDPAINVKRIRGSGAWSGGGYDRSLATEEDGSAGSNTESSQRLMWREEAMYLSDVRNL